MVDRRYRQWMDEKGEIIIIIIVVCFDRIATSRRMRSTQQMQVVEHSMQEGKKISMDDTLSFLFC